MDQIIARSGDVGNTTLVIASQHMQSATFESVFRDLRTQRVFETIGFDTSDCWVNMAHDTHFHPRFVPVEARNGMPNLDTELQAYVYLQWVQQ